MGNVPPDVKPRLPEENGANAHHEEAPADDSFKIYGIDKKEDGLIYYRVHMPGESEVTWKRPDEVRQSHARELMEYLEKIDSMAKK